MPRLYVVTCNNKKRLTLQTNAKAQFVETLVLYPLLTFVALNLWIVLLYTSGMLHHSIKHSKDRYISSDRL